MRLSQLQINTETNLSLNYRVGRQWRDVLQRQRPHRAAGRSRSGDLRGRADSDADSGAQTTQLASAHARDQRQTAGADARGSAQICGGVPAQAGD